MESFQTHRFVFVGGLHRSGTSALYRLLGSDPNISCFQNTGVIEDEGQYLQTVFPIEDDYGDRYGGPGLFALKTEAHWTETCPLVGKAKEQLFQDWSRYWDLTKPILAEKTPANLIRSRFLQTIFPNSGFIFLMRHPVANALATSKWTGPSWMPMTTLISNWLASYKILFSDLQNINTAIVLKYEDFSSNPEKFENEIAKVIGRNPNMAWDLIRAGLNDRYFDLWRDGSYHLSRPRHHWKTVLKRWKNIAEVALIEKRFEKDINQFGYSFTDVHEGRI
jgi:hypothetical protein